jgi:hypothetical protein
MLSSIIIFRPIFNGFRSEIILKDVFLSESNTYYILRLVFSIAFYVWNFKVSATFNLTPTDSIEFFWKIWFDDEIEYGNDLYQPNPVRCISVIYYFWLSIDENNVQRKDKQTLACEKLAALLSRTISNFVDIIQNELCHLNSSMK